MRTWVYNRIKGVPEVAAIVGNRITSSGSSDNPTPPFLVVSMGTEQPPAGMPSSSRTQEIPFDVWVHDRPGSMLKIDDAAKYLKDALPTADGAVVGGMSVLKLWWEETGADAFDDHYSTNTRRVSFRMMTRR